MQLLYALRKTDSGLVHVDSVPTGNQCGCVCPGCGEDLVAKNKGKIKEHHFAHDKDYKCHHGYQTQLHLLSKEIFSEINQLRLPAFATNINELLVVTIQKETIIQIKETKTEIKLNSIIPDITLTDSLDQNYLIEIKVTHAVDEEKTKKIIDLNISCLEIDLSSFELESKEQLKNRLLESTHNWKWIYFKDQDKKINDLKQFTETIGLVTNDEGATYTCHCPLKKFSDTNLTTANYIQDCQKCPYKLGSDAFESLIQCGGKLKIKDGRDLDKIKEAKKENTQIVYAKLRDRSSFTYPLLNELKFGTILELWEGKQLLVKKMDSDLGFMIKTNPIMTNEKYKKVFGDLYSNGVNRKPDTKIYGFKKRVWYKVTKSV